MKTRHLSFHSFCCHSLSLQCLSSQNPHLKDYDIQQERSCSNFPVVPAGIGTDPECRLSRLLVCDWLTLNARHPMLRPELLALRETGYATCEQASTPDPRDLPLDAALELPAREQCPWTDNPFGLSRNVHPLTSALTADITAEVGVVRS